MVTFISLGLWALLLPQDDPTRQAREFVQKLRSDKIEERQEAERKLKELGKAALPELVEAAKDKDVEQSSRARYLIRYIELGERVSSNLREALPGVQDRLASGDAHTWTEEFLKIAGGPREKRNFPSLATTDLDPLVVSALAGCATDLDKTYVIQSAMSWRLPSVAPEAARLLGEKDHQLRGACARAVAELDYKEAIPLVAVMVLDDRGTLRRTAIRSLRLLGPSRAFQELKKSLEDKKSGHRNLAIFALGQLRVKEAAVDIAKLLHDDNGTVRAYAAAALGDLRAIQSASEVAALLSDKAEMVRGEAALSLASMGEKQRIAELMPLLSDPAFAVREKVIRALATLQAQELRGRLLPLLADPEPVVRGSSLWAIGLLGAQEFRPEVVKRLSDKAIQVRSAAIECLTMLKGDIPEVAALLKDPDEGTRIEARHALCRAGSREAAEWLIDQGYQPHSLNQFRRPAEWKALKGTLVVEEWEGSPRRVLEQFAESCGWSVDWPKDRPREDYWTADFVRVSGRGAPKTQLEALEEIFNVPSEMGHYCYVLESKRIRILSTSEASDFWNSWRSDNMKQK